jgi:hypothetical protein
LWDAGVLSGRGHKYVLTVIDVFSKFALAIPIKNKKATTVAAKLHKHVFSVFGDPERLHSDNGLEFCNTILEALCNFKGIEKSRTTAYHPQGNSVAERIHQFFRNALAAFVGRDQRDWDIFLPTLMHVYLDTIHSALGGFTPAQIMFGRRLDLPLVSVQDEGDEPKSRVIDFVVKLELALDRANKIVLGLAKRKEFKNIKPSLGKKTLSYNVGDKVGLQVEFLPAGVKSKKLFPRFSGPFTVSKATHDGKVLYLADVHGKIRKVPVSISNVKPWPDRQTLLEQFEKYEILKRKISPVKISELPSVIPKETISSPEGPVVYESESEDSLLDMVADEVVTSPPVIALNEPLDLDYERYFEDDDDCDIMGNPISYDISLIRDEVVKNFNTLTQGMYFINEVPILKHRLLYNPTNYLRNYIEHNIYFIHSNNFQRSSYKCTNISIS